MLWWQSSLIVVAGAALGLGILFQTPWYKTRRYAMNLQKVYEKHKLQEKAEAVQALGQTPNPNPVLMRKPLRELISTYEVMIADMNKLKVPAKCQTIHELSVEAAKESLAMYQMASIGGFRQKALQEKQRKIQKMQEQLQVEMEKLYGKLKEKKK